jgi:predicted transposase/invertase (TIGR01784 family)
MPISKFLDPKNDVAFKKIFGTEKNKDILIHFLNDMLVFKERNPIQEVTFLKTIQDPDIVAKKTSIVDILCKDGVGNSYIVEMQVAKTKGFEKRAQYYASKAYSGQINQGGKYETLKEVIFLAIADFVMFPGKLHYKSDHIILDKETHEHDLKDFSFTFLELEKFTKTKEELSTLIEKWVYFFKHAEETTEADLKEIIGQDFIIQKAYEELNRFYWNEDELSAYEAVIKKESDYIASMEQKYDEGFLKGKNEGFSEGQQKEKLLLATRMLETGSDQDFVIKITGLKPEDVVYLKEELKLKSS